MKTVVARSHDQSRLKVREFLSMLYVKIGTKLRSKVVHFVGQELLLNDWMDELGVQELGESKWTKEIHALNQQASPAHLDIYALDPLLELLQVIDQYLYLTLV